MKNSSGINGRGLSPDEIQQAIDRTVQFRHGSGLEDWPEQRKRIIHDITRYDTEFAKQLIQEIKQYHPDLLKGI